MKVFDDSAALAVVFSEPGAERAEGLLEIGPSSSRAMLLGSMMARTGALPRCARGVDNSRHGRCHDSATVQFT